MNGETDVLPISVLDTQLYGMYHLKSSIKVKSSIDEALVDSLQQNFFANKFPRARMLGVHAVSIPFFPLSM